MSPYAAVTARSPRDSSQDSRGIRRLWCPSTIPRNDEREGRSRNVTRLARPARAPRAGRARIIVDEAFVGAAASQQRWKNALGPLQVLWVGVRCDATVAAGRELARGDRIVGMAASQADLVHRGVVYDLQVDTTHTEALECAEVIAARLR